MMRHGDRRLETGRGGANRPGRGAVGNRKATAAERAARGRQRCDPGGVDPCDGRSPPGVSLPSTARLIAGNPPGSILVNVSGPAAGGAGLRRATATPWNSQSPRVAPQRLPQGTRANTALPTALKRLQPLRNCNRKGRCIELETAGGGHVWTAAETLQGLRVARGSPPRVAAAKRPRAI